MTDKVLITVKEYKQLLEDQWWLCYLEEAGVDNWSAGYDYAHELSEQDETDRVASICASIEARLYKDDK